MADGGHSPALRLLLRLDLELRAKIGPQADGFVPKNAQSGATSVRGRGERWQSDGCRNKESTREELRNGSRGARCA